MNRLTKYCSAVGVAVALSFAATTNANADEQASQFVTQHINQLQQETHGRAAQFKQNPQELRTLLANNLTPIADFPYISAMVMGRYYRFATPEQRQHFAQVFQNSTLDTLTQGLLSINYDGIEVGHAAQQQRYANETGVSVNVRTANGQTYPIDFTLAQRNGQWKVINVIVNGINLGLTFRNQFDSAMRSHNHNFDQVIDSWDTSSAVNKIQKSNGSNNG